MSKTRLVIGIAGFAMAILSTAAGAQNKPGSQPDAERGALLAQRLCTGCHLVAGGQSSDVTVGVPSFNAIANKPSQTKDAIAGVLIRPHAPMPNIQLSTQEIGDIIAYLDQLRREDVGQPLLNTTKQRPKPKYPKQS
ncbi:MAG: c-type cytochrome [Hyphomicrobiaceae bacterium]